MRTYIINHLRHGSSILFYTCNLASQIYCNEVLTVNRSRCWWERMYCADIGKYLLTNLCGVELPKALQVPGASPIALLLGVSIHHTNIIWLAVIV